MSEPPSKEAAPQTVVQAKLIRPAAGSSSDLYHRVLHSRLAILATLFCVTGFLGLPLLWMNPNFTRMQRWGWAIVVTVYTCLLIALVCWVVVWSWNSVSNQW